MKALKKKQLEANIARAKANVADYEVKEMKLQAQVDSVRVEIAAQNDAIETYEKDLGELADD